MMTPELRGDLKYICLILCTYFYPSIDPHHVGFKLNHVPKDKIGIKGASLSSVYINASTSIRLLKDFQICVKHIRDSARFDVNE